MFSYHPLASHAVTNHIPSPSGEITPSRENGHEMKKQWCKRTIKMCRRKSFTTQTELERWSPSWRPRKKMKNKNRKCLQPPKRISGTLHLERFCQSRVAFLHGKGERRRCRVFSVDNKSSPFHSARGCGAMQPDTQSCAHILFALTSNFGFDLWPLTITKKHALSAGAGATLTASRVIISMTLPCCFLLTGVQPTTSVVLIWPGCQFTWYMIGTQTQQTHCSLLFV